MVVIIFDTKNFTSYVDKNAYDYIVSNYPGEWKLDQHGYLFVNTDKKINKIHRLVFEANGIEIPENLQVDHINKNILDNTLENLRIVTQSINNFNRGKQKNNKSGYIGVFYRKDKKKYVAYINYKGKKKHLGYYDNEIKAAYAYNVAKRKILNDDKKFVYNDVDNLLDDITKDAIEMDVISKF